jgi:hypothetical protein
VAAANQPLPTRRRRSQSPQRAPFPCGSPGRKTIGQKCLDLALAQSGRRSQQLAMIVLRHVRPQKREPSQVNPAFRESLQCLRKTTPQARHLNPLVGDLLGKAEPSGAEGEHRRARFF